MDITFLTSSAWTFPSHFLSSFSKAIKSSSNRVNFWSFNCFRKTDTICLMEGDYGCLRFVAEDRRAKWPASSFQWQWRLKREQFLVKATQLPRPVPEPFKVSVVIRRIHELVVDEHLDRVRIGFRRISEHEIRPHLLQNSIRRQGAACGRRQFKGDGGSVLELRLFDIVESTAKSMSTSTVDCHTKLHLPPFHHSTTRVSSRT